MLMSLPNPDALYPPCGISETIGMWSLIHTHPASISRLARCARKVLVVQAEAASPNGTSLASAMPSSSVSKGSTTSTGPKSSSWTISESCAAPTTSVGG